MSVVYAAGGVGYDSFHVLIGGGGLRRRPFFFPLSFFSVGSTPSFAGFQTKAEPSSTLATGEGVRGFSLVSFFGILSPLFLHRVPIGKSMQLVSRDYSPLFQARGGIKEAILSELKAIDDEVEARLEDASCAKQAWEQERKSMEMEKQHYWDFTSEADVWHHVPVMLEESSIRALPALIQTKIRSFEERYLSGVIRPPAKRARVEEADEAEAGEEEDEDDSIAQVLEMARLEHVPI